MATSERKKLSKIANQGFSFFHPYTDEIIVHEAAIPTPKENLKTRLVVFRNRVLLLLDARLSIYGEKRRKTKLKLSLCKFIFNSDSSLLVRISLSHFSQHDSKLDNQGDLKMPIEDITI